jgi:hypothetical protein
MMVVLNWTHESDTAKRGASDVTVHVLAAVAAYINHGHFVRSFMLMQHGIQKGNV